MRRIENNRNVFTAEADTIFQYTTVIYYCPSK